MALEIRIDLKGNPAAGVYPCSRIELNDIQLADRPIKGNQTLTFVVEPNDKNRLHIIHYGKGNRDTKTDASGNIVEDRSLEIVGIKIGGVDIKSTVLNMQKFYVSWPDNLVSDYRKRNQDPPQYLINNLYLGFNGRYEFEFPGDPQILHYEQLWLDEIQAHQNQTLVRDGREVFNRPDGYSQINKEFDLTIHDLDRLING